MATAEIEEIAPKIIKGFAAFMLTASATVVILGGLQLQQAASWRKEHPVICKAEPAGGLLCDDAEGWQARDERLAKVREMASRNEPIPKTFYMDANGVIQRKLSAW